MTGDLSPAPARSSWPRTVTPLLVLAIVASAAGAVLSIDGMVLGGQPDTPHTELRETQSTWAFVAMAFLAAGALLPDVRRNRFVAAAVVGLVLWGVAATVTAVGDTGVVWAADLAGPLTVARIAGYVTVPFAFLGHAIQAPRGA